MSINGSNEGGEDTPGVPRGTDEVVWATTAVVEGGGEEPVPEMKEWMRANLPFAEEVTEKYVEGMVANGCETWEVARYQTASTLEAFRDGRGALFLPAHVPVMWGKIQEQVDAGKGAGVAAASKSQAARELIAVEEWKIQRKESASRLPTLPTVLKGKISRAGMEAYVIKMMNAVALTEGGGAAMASGVRKVVDVPTRETLAAVRSSAQVAEMEERRLGSLVLAQASEEMSVLIGDAAMGDGRLLTIMCELAQSVYLGPARELEEAWGALTVPPQAGRYITEEWRRAFRQVVDRLVRLIPGEGGVDKSQLARAVRAATLEAREFREVVAMEERMKLGGDAMGYERLWELTGVEARVNRAPHPSSKPNPSNTQHKAFFAGDGQEKVALPAPRAAGSVACRDWANGKCTYGEKCRFKHQAGARVLQQAGPQVAMVAAAAGDACHQRAAVPRRGAPLWRRWLKRSGFTQPGAVRPVTQNVHLWNHMIR